jgi:poly(A) polymerase
MRPAETRCSRRTGLRVQFDPGLARMLGEIRRFLRTKRTRGFVVGGLVRDRLLGVSSKDMDIVVGTEPFDLAFHLHKRLGLSHPVIFPRFKTARTAGEGFTVEICGIQGTLAEDAARRDFTVNCLYVDLDAPVCRSGSRIMDPTGKGLADLRRGLLRTPVDPCTTLWLDPVRILRALRFAATGGLKIAAPLRACIPRVVYLLDRVSKERVRGEIERILLSKRVISAFREMAALGICDVVLPELGRTYGFDQTTPYHAHDLFTHSLKATALVPPDLTLRLAALLHDLGKPDTRLMKGGRAVYYGHQDVSADLAVRVMQRLRFPRHVRERVAFLVRHHMIHYSRAWSDKAVRRFVRRMGHHLDAMLTLAEADQKAQVPGSGPDIPALHLRMRIRGLKEAGSINPRLPVDGREIMSVLGIEEGPLVGAAKKRLLEAVSESDRPLSREEALALLGKWLGRG